jgi:hypothetical protein
MPFLIVQALHLYGVTNRVVAVITVTFLAFWVKITLIALYKTVYFSKLMSTKHLLQIKHWIYIS